MDEKVRVFIDFWNFQLAWNEYANGARLDWPAVPRVLLEKVRSQAALDGLRYDGTRVYASVDVTKPSDSRLKGWLRSFLDRQAGFNVYIRERRPRVRKIHCKQCDKDFSDCPHCGEKLMRSAEKGVDAAIVTDMMSLAWEGAYSVAILVSSDADYIPAVERLQEKGIKVINATWANMGHDLARTCWVSIRMDKIIEQLTRQE